MNSQEKTYLQKFNEWLIIQGKSSKTAISFCSNVTRFLQWLEKQNIEAENTNYADILAYIQYLKNRGNKQRTQQATVNMLKHFFNFLQSEEAITENPAAVVIIRGVKRKILHETLTPQELEHICQSYQVERKYEPEKIIPPQYKNTLARKRNKIILGLLIYQGLRAGELAAMELQDVKLRDGKIFIAGSRRTEERTMKLEAHQIYDIMDYVNETRKQILAITGKQTSKVFISINRSPNFNNIMQKLTKSIRQINLKVKDVKHLRASVITNWLKIYNLRKVQYLAGHRYVSSTESYQLNNIEELQDDIRKYHPIG